MSNENFGAWLRDNRKVIGLSLAQLANAAGYDEETIRTLEDSDSYVAPDVLLVRIAEALQVNPDYILIRAGLCPRWMREMAREDGDRIVAAMNELKSGPKPGDTLGVIHDSDNKIQKHFTQGGKRNDILARVGEITSESSMEDAFRVAMGSVIVEDETGQKYEVDWAPELRPITDEDAEDIISSYEE